MIVSYYWPPAGGPGVQRWLKFVKYLPEFGYEPIVFIPKHPSYPILDLNLEKEVSKEIQIIKQDFFEPYQIAQIFAPKKTNQMRAGFLPSARKMTRTEKILLWMRGNLFIPDARIFWVKPAVKALQKIIAEQKIDTIITTGPPHSLHLIGFSLQQKTNIRWIADFRDPWTTISYHQSLQLSAWAQKKHEKLEAEVLQKANAIIVTSKVTRNEFLLKTKKPIHVITNGYDDEISTVATTLDHYFSIAHIGTFLSERNPRILWKALIEICRENDQFRKDFKLKLVGRTSPEILATISEFKLDIYLDNIGYVSHLEAIKIQKSVQVLLLIEIDSEQTKCIIPGKLFEYMKTHRPIVALGPEGSDVASILKKTQTGTYFEYDQKEELKMHIEGLYEQFKAGNLQVSPIGIQKYARKSLTKKLVEVLKRSK